MSDPDRITQTDTDVLLGHIRVLSDRDARTFHRAVIEVEKARRWLKKDPTNPKRKVDLEVMLRQEARLRQKLFLPQKELREETRPDPLTSRPAAP